MKSGRNLNSIPEQVRVFLCSLAKAKISTKKDKEKASKAIDVTGSAVEAMIYHGKGGLDAWSKLIAYLYDLSPNQVINLLTELRDSLRKKSKLKEADVQWSTLTEQLSEDRKYFWHDLIRAMEPVYEIRKRKARKKKTQ